MPTYTCAAAPGLLDPERRGAIARAVTAAHAEITGAPAYFAQVIFEGVAEGDHFIGGAPLAHDHLFVYGRIRAGRSAEVRNALMKRLVADVAKAANLPAFAIWVYLQELPPAAMAEFGHILPEPGDEAEWSRNLPAQDLERMQAILSGPGPDGD
jgi:phenylpyruvate tautomerase PptA (4-oxalocrotonate tautomerase family)